MPPPWEAAQSLPPWEAAQGQQIKNAPPGYNTLGPKADVDLAQSIANLTRTRGTMQAEETKTKNEATKSGFDALNAATDYRIKNGVPPGNASLGGQAYLNSLPVGIRDMTQAMLNYRYPGEINRAIPAVEQAVMAAQHVNGNFDPTVYNARRNLLKNAYDGSPLSQSIQALNTAIVHGGKLYDQAARLPGNSDLSSIPILGGPLTQAHNAFEVWSHSNDPNLTNFLGTSQRYAQESSKAYNIDNQAGQQEVREPYSPNLSSKTIQSNLRNDLDLYGGKLAALLQPFRIGGSGLPPIDLLNPDARAVLQRISPDTLKHFDQNRDPQAIALGIAPGGNQPPSNGGGSTATTGVAPAPTGPTGPNGGNLGPSTNGYNDKPDPASAAFWDSAAHQGLSYRDALDQWRISTAGRDLTTVQPPDPDQYGKAAAYMQAHQNVDYHPFQSVTRTPLNVGTSIMNGIAQNPGGAFAGHYYNMLSSALPQTSAGDEGAYFDAVSRQQNPRASLMGDLLGTVGGAYNVTKGVGAISRGLQDAGAPALNAYGNIMGGNAARAALTGDSIYGAISGAAQNPNNPVAGGAMGMGIMGLGNVAGRYTLGPAAAWLGDTRPAQAVVNGARSLGDLVRRPFGGVPSAPFNPPAAPDVSLSSATQNALPGITAKLQQAQDAGLPYMPADADPRLRAMLGSATRYSPDVQAQAESILQPRQDGRWERAIGQIDSNLAPTGNVPDIVKDANARASAAANPLYDQAFAQSAPNLAQNPALSDILNHPSLQPALRNAYNIAENPADLSFATGPEGNPIINANPTWKTIHYVRRGLDQQINGLTDPITGNVMPGMSDYQGNLIGLRKKLNGQIAQLNPTFADADAKYADIASQGSAAQQGANLASATRATPEQAQAAVTSAGDNLPYLQQGHASTLADIIGGNKFQTDPYRAVSGSPFQTQNLGIIYPQGADAFATAKGLEGDMAKTYQSVLGGSPTQPRAMDDKRFALSLGDLADGGVDAAVAAATGNPASLGMLFMRKGIDAAKFGMNQQKAEAIAPFLMNTDPRASLGTLDRWIQQNTARNEYLSRIGGATGQIGAGVMGAPAIYGAVQN